MTIQLNQTQSRPFLIAFALWISLGVAASCSSDDQATSRGHVKHPVEPTPNATQKPVMSTPPRPDLTPPETSTTVTAPPSVAPSVERPLSMSERYEQSTGMKLSPLEKTIMEDCPDRAWSKNVPKRRCTKDSECGDGFCDRGRCAAVWTCLSGHGQRCESDDHCSVRPCVDGRCRSCVSDAECRKIWPPDGECVAHTVVLGARSCIGNLPSIMAPATGGPLPANSGR